MKFKFISLILGCILFSFLSKPLLYQVYELYKVNLIWQPNYAPIIANPNPPMIMHAGGGIANQTYTNTLEALNANYQKGKRYFELDFDITQDKRVVCIHTWEQLKDFDITKRPLGIPTHAEFMQFRRRDGLKQMDLEMLAQWLKQHPDAFVITDVKSDQFFVLRNIQTNYPKLKTQFIPQIYELYEYAPIYDMGFEKIIFTLYAKPYMDWIILAFIKKHPLWALTMPKEWIHRSIFSKSLNLNLPVYLHTFKDQLEFKQYHLPKQVNGYFDFD